MPKMRPVDQRVQMLWPDNAHRQVNRQMCAKSLPTELKAFESRNVVTIAVHVTKGPWGLVCDPVDVPLALIPINF